MIFSLPHFLDGDPNILHRVIGLKPNREEHQSVIDIEPVSAEDSVEMVGLTIRGC